MRRTRLVLMAPITGVVLWAGMGVALAVWSYTANTQAYGKAVTMPAGATPAVSASGPSVTVSWSQGTFPSGSPVNGYVVKRYDATTNLLQPIGPGCSGTIPGLACTENNVPAGSWKYSVTPTQSSWTGSESSKSATVTILPAPTVSSVSPSSRGQGASDQSLTITGTGFVNGATASFSGTGITVSSTTFVSSTSLTENVTVASNAATTSRNVTVTNPDTQTGSCSGCFTVNPGPTVTSVSPSSRGQGASSQSITITGTGFVSGATATFSGTGITVSSTSFVSSTSLTAMISITASATTGTRSVTVTDPDAGEGSCSSCFTVNAAPTISSISPSSLGQGSTGQSITVNGSGFVGGPPLSASFTGNGITVNSTTFVSGTQLTVNLTISNNASVGMGDLTVTNGDAGSGSCTNCFTVNPGPNVSSTSPSSRAQGASSQSITVNGSNFVSGATATFGSGITVNSTTFVSSTQLTATISIASNATTGSRAVTVTNPDAGMGSCASCFTVVSAPTVSSTSPASRGQGAASQNITISGTGFSSGAAATFSAGGITVNSTTFVSSTQLTANITIASTATTGAGNVTVTNTDGGTASCSGCFTVNAAPTILTPTAAVPAQVLHGTTSDVQITGTGFVSGAAVTISGGFTVNSVTVNSSVLLTVNVTAGGAGQGTYDITVTNPDQGKVTCSGCIKNL